MARMLLSLYSFPARAHLLTTRGRAVVLPDGSCALSGAAPPRCPFLGFSSLRFCSFFINCLTFSDRYDILTLLGKTPITKNVATCVSKQTAKGDL